MSVKAKIDITQYPYNFIKHMYVTLNVYKNITNIDIEKFNEYMSQLTQDEQTLVIYKYVNSYSNSKCVELFNITHNDLREHLQNIHRKIYRNHQHFLTITMDERNKLHNEMSRLKQILWDIIMGETNTKDINVNIKSRTINVPERRNQTY